MTAIGSSMASNYVSKGSLLQAVDHQRQTSHESEHGSVSFAPFPSLDSSVAGLFRGETARTKGAANQDARSMQLGLRFLSRYFERR